MQLKFKQQAYQSDAVRAIKDCFLGQPKSEGKLYALDPGRSSKAEVQRLANLVEEGFANPDIKLSKDQVLQNIQKVQQRFGLNTSTTLSEDSICSYNLDVEMETGTGKTYCYIKTMFELHRNYGWSKYIIVVPSIAIREGVKESFVEMSDHFMEAYGCRARFFVYDSSRLDKLEAFSSDPGINVMIINVQAFAARGEDARRIYLELDEFQSRKPIDVISKNRPILILDEPQKMEGQTTVEKLREFNPLMVLRYSATHKTPHDKAYRLDAIDAYNQKLVKKIRVRGITARGMQGTAPYLYLEGISVSSSRPPEAKVDIEIKQANKIKRVRKTLNKQDNLYEISGGLDQYRGFVVSEINAASNTIEFTNGNKIQAGETIGDQSESTLRRIQIREAIKAHLEVEAEHFKRGIKVLTLFFIDEVAKYKNYDDVGQEHPGEYALMFEEEYDALLKEFRQLEDSPYQEFLLKITASQTHEGYFSVDKKSKRLVNPKTRSSGEAAGEAEDLDAYDLILRDKRTLLQYPSDNDDSEVRRKKQVRFIFSHSALREGWDNPNIFVICTLKQSNNNVSRRQEIGRGMRLCRDQDGNRVDDPEIVHSVNVLTVIASESYSSFVAGLQNDISSTLSSRPMAANKEYFLGKILTEADGSKSMVTDQMATVIYKYLVKHDYIDDADRVSEVYHEAKRAGMLAEMPPTIEPQREQILALVDAVFSTNLLPEIVDDLRGTTNSLNANFAKKEFQELWNRINRKAIYAVEFDSHQLVQKCVGRLNAELKVAPLQYVVTWGNQGPKADYESVTRGESFEEGKSQTETHTLAASSSVKYDLLGKLSEITKLTRRTVAAILSKVKADTFLQFRTNPEDFILKCSILINEEKATMVIERLTYNPIDDRYSSDIFTAAKREDLSRGFPAKRHVYDYVLTDSSIEREFAKALEGSSEVAVYAKLPRGFLIPTPVGNYNPDWAIVFTENSVKHIYFIAETKGTLSSMELRKVEETKISCARKFFLSITSDKVKYDIVNSYEKLMEIVK
jgi:type III restriction enzyme